MLKKIYHPKLYIGIVITVLLMMGVYLFLCRLAGQQAAEIFNAEMARQKTLEGTVTVDAITADMWGNVGFRGLKWLDTNGDPVVFVPDGRFKVKPWDIITQNVDLSTLQEAEFNNPAIAIRFNKDMRPSFLPSKKEEDKKPEDGEKRKRRRGMHINLPENLEKCKISINNCMMTVRYRHRFFVLPQVNFVVQALDNKTIDLKLSTGTFGGMIIGDKLTLNGKVLFNGNTPQLDLFMTMKNIVPDSMGLRNVKDTASVYGHVTGPVDGPFIDGRIDFQQLNIPPLHFYKVQGDFYYQDGRIDFKNVTGGLYGGDVEATGMYDIDTRGYEIDALGHKLMASIAAKTNQINCSVELDLKMRSDGNPKSVLTYGSFTSGAGTYNLVPFESISGSFSNQYGVLKFTDVKIKTPLGEVSSDAFEIVKGRVHIKDIWLTAPDGEKIQVK